MRVLLRAMALCGAAWALAVATAPARAQGAAPNEALEIQFRSVSVPQNSVPAVAQDRAGFVWVATSRGLTRYDGYRLHPVELRDPSAKQRNLGWTRALAPSSQGGMWIGTEFLGLMVYDAPTDRVRALGSGAGLQGPHAPIRALAEDPQGGVWVGTVGQGLFHYRPDTGRFEAQALLAHGEPETRVLALLASPRGERGGSVWAGHWRGLSRREGGAWVELPLPGLPRGTPVQALAETRDGRVWLGTQTGELGVVEDGQVRWVLKGLSGPVQALAEASNGLLWVGTKTGLLWVNPASGALEAHLRQDPRRPLGLVGNDISGLLRDQDGAMWVSGYGLGLQRHLQHPALAVRGPDLDASSPLADADVRAVLTLRSGEVLAAKQSGRLVRLDGRPGRALAALGVWPRERRTVVEALAEAPDGNLWLAAAGRLEHRTAQGALLRDWPMDGGRAQQLVVRADGSVWIGLQEGLYRLDGPQAPQLSRVHPAVGEALQGGVNSLLDDPERQTPRGTELATLWVGGQQGLFRWQGGQLQRVLAAPGEALGSPVVIALLRSRDGTLWVDTPVVGLHRQRGWDAQGRARFEAISPRHGLEGVYGGNLHEDAQGRIWSQLHVYDPKQDRVDSFGPAEGAAFGSFWFFASAELPGARLLFGGSRGLLLVQPEAFRPAGSAPRLVVSSVRVNGEPHHADGPARGLSLPSGTRNLSVEFAGLDYADPMRLRYQYRLLGLDTEWANADIGARSPTFGPLKPGRYTLQVRAGAHHALQGAAELNLPIELLPAWWQTPWAQAAAGLLGLLGVWSLVQWRTATLRRREATLQALVDERTAELRELSLTDALTGLRNRRYLELSLDDDLRRCQRRFEPTATQPPGPDSDLLLMLLDLDHFKRVNDVHGHSAGDAVLVQLAERLRHVFRDTDSLVRWGGEEVLALVRDTDRHQAAELAARVGAAVRDRAFDLGGGRQVHVTVSIGFVAYPLDPAHPRAWDWATSLQLADAALYAAKDQGRDGFVGATQAHGLRPAAAQGDLAALLGDPRLAVLRSTG